MNCELKACPWCGGGNIDPPAYRVAYARCIDCNAYGPSAEHKHGDSQQEFIARAVAAWNTRPTPAPGALPELPEPAAWMRGFELTFEHGRIDSNAAVLMGYEPLFGAPQVHAYARAYAEQCRAGVWMPIESAPKDGAEDVFLLLRDGESVRARWWLIETDEFDYDVFDWVSVGSSHVDFSLHEPTHWRPALQSAFADDEGVKRG